MEDEGRADSVASLQELWGGGRSSSYRRSKASSSDAPSTEIIDGDARHEDERLPRRSLVRHASEGLQGMGKHELLLENRPRPRPRRSASATERGGHISKPRKPSDVDRRGSDNSLLGAKSLILSALTAKEQRTRRLTDKLEMIEAELRHSIGRCGTGSQGRRSPGQTRDKSCRAIGRNSTSSSNVSPASRLSEETADADESLAVTIDNVDDLMNSPDEGPPEAFEVGPLRDDETIGSMDEEERVQHLEAEHANLQNEHLGLQGEIARMTTQLSWIESQLEATKGHARCLSRSTSDWAGMMKQISHAHTVQEQRRVLRQGAMVIKHSEKKRGCGPRFLAFDAQSARLSWAKGLHGAADLCRLIAGGADLSRDAAVSDGSPPSLATTEEIGGSARVSNTTSVPIVGIRQVLHGEEELRELRFPKANQAAALVCHTRPECVLAVFTRDTGGAMPYLFEFFDAEVADSFAEGLKEALARGVEAQDSGLPLPPAIKSSVAPPGGEDSPHETSSAPGGRSKAPLSSLDLDSPHRTPGSRSSPFGTPRSSKRSTPMMTTSTPKVSTAGSTSASGTPATPRRMTGKTVASRLLFGPGENTPEASHNNSFRSDVGSVGTVGSVRSAATRGSVRSLNTSFELKTLDPSKTVQALRVSQLQRDLTQVRSRQAYLEVLVGAAERSQLVLPLSSSQEQRNQVANHAQVLKDLQRESAILVNAVSEELGSAQNTRKAVKRIKELVRKTLHDLCAEEDACDPAPELVDRWCKEILLASSRTVIAGDVYSVCHRLLTGPPEVLLLPAADGTSPLPIEVFVAPDGLVTIECETSFRVVHMSESGGGEEWAKVHARCIELLTLSHEQPAVEGGQMEERNIRSLKLDFEP